MSNQEKTPMVTREVVRPSLETFRRDVEKEEQREDEEAHAHPKRNQDSSTWFLGGKL